MQVLSVSAPGLDWKFSAAAAKNLSRSQLSRDWFLVADPNKDVVDLGVVEGAARQELEVRGRFAVSSSRLEIKLSIPGLETALRTIRLNIDELGAAGATPSGAYRLDKLISRCAIICREKGKPVQVVCRLPIDVDRSAADGAFDIDLSRSTRASIGEFISDVEGGAQPWDLFIALHFRTGDVALAIAAPELVFSSIDLAAAREAGKIGPASIVAPPVSGRGADEPNRRRGKVPSRTTRASMTRVLEQQPELAINELGDSREIDADLDRDVHANAGEGVFDEAGAAHEQLVDPEETQGTQPVTWAESWRGQAADGYADDVPLEVGDLTSRSAEEAPLGVAGYSQGDDPVPALEGAWYRAASGEIIGWIASSAQGTGEVPVELISNGKVLAVTNAQLVTETAAQGDLPIRADFQFGASALRRYRRRTFAVRIAGGPLLAETTEERQREAERKKFCAISEIAGEIRRREHGDTVPLLTSQQAALLAKLFGGVAFDTRQARQTAAEFLSSVLKQPEVRTALLDPLQYRSGPLPHYRNSPAPTRAELAEVVELLQPGEDTKAIILQQRTWVGVLRAIFADVTFWRSAIELDDINDLFLYSRILQFASDDNAIPQRCVYRPADGAILLPVMQANGDGARGDVDVEVYSRSVQPIVAARGRLQGEMIAVPTTGDDKPALLAIRHTDDAGQGSGWRVFEVLEEGTAASEIAEPVEHTADVVITRLLVRGVIVEATCLSAREPARLRFELSVGTIHLEVVAETLGAEGASSGLTSYRYVGTLPLPLARPLFLAGSEAHRAADWYDLRVVEVDGAPRPAGLPNVLEPAAATGPLFGAILIDGGHVSGWVADPQDIKQPVRVRLVAVAADLDSGLDASIGETEPPIVLSMRANNRAAAAVDVFGGAFGKCGFRLAMPPALLDGREYKLSLDALTGSEPHLIWTTTFKADEQFIFEQIAGISDSSQMQQFLVRLGCAGRADMLSDLYGNRHSLLPVDLTEIQHFEIIASLFSNLPQARQLTVLSALFDSLWAHAMTSNQRLNEFVNVARSATLAAQPARIRVRFPESPLTEAAVDLIFASERAGDDNADLVLRRAVDAVAANRLQIARGYLDRAREKHRDHPGIQVQAGRVAMTFGDLSSAKQAAISALAIKPGLKEAEILLAQTLSREGRGLEAAVLAGRGEGVVSAMGKPISYERALMTMQLDWVQTITDAATADIKETLVDLMRRTKEIYTSSELPEEVDFSVAFVRGVKLGESVHDIFQQAGKNCRQVSVLEQDDVTTAISLGRWTFVLTEDFGITPCIAARILSERRPFELVLQLVGGESESKGSDVNIRTLGLVIRSDVLRSAASSSFDEFLLAAGQRFKIKRIAI